MISSSFLPQFPQLVTRGLALLTERLRWTRQPQVKQLSATLPSAAEVGETSAPCLQNKYWVPLHEIWLCWGGARLAGKPGSLEDK